MVLITLGALQGIPSDLSEAAYVDGATGWKTFKRVVFPLLLISVAPLLISSFAFNFNNFNAINLLTGGGPIAPGQSAGRTDILISYTYRLAFGSARGADYGLASAVSVIIFFIVASISTFSFRFTKTFEEVR
jgi:ABC-type sugar transport system permease subunit